MAKLLLGDYLQNPKLNEETAQQILSLLQSPISSVMHNLTQPVATITQPELVTRVPASLVTTKSLDQRNTTATTKRAQTTHQKSPTGKIY